MRRLSRGLMAILVGGAIAWVAWALLNPFLPDMGAAATAVGFVAVLYGLHKVAQRAERRGWIYYQHRHGSWGAVGAAMTEVHAIYRPGMRHVKEFTEDMHVHREDDDEGDRPEP